MPIYEFACDSCLVMYETRLAIDDPRPSSCPECDSQLRRVLSPPLLNTSNLTSPTAAKYSGLSVSDEIARERELQKVYRTIWLPPEVKHSPWDEDDH